MAIRLFLFVILSAFVAMSFSALLLFVRHDFHPTHVEVLNIIIRLSISFVYFIAAFMIWCWGGYLILSPLTVDKKA